MKVIISLSNDYNSFPNVGMNNRQLVSRYKTRRGVIRYAQQIAFKHNRMFIRLEYLAEDGYGEPVNIEFMERLERNVYRKRF